jgi:Domain of unknown function (DUF4349)
MRFSIALFLSVILLIVSGCASFERSSMPKSQQTSSNATAPAARTTEAPQNADFKKVSLAQADQSQAATAAIERKIIRNAELTIEVAAPGEAQRKAASIAETHGGFVITSEAQQSDGTAQPAEVVNITMRVPAAQFDAAVSEIRALGSRVRQEKTTGQDVTEEFIDLEARLRAQRALEAQYLEIMKGASRVTDALEVNRQLAEVRGVIEQVEGRRRFLENQATLSTIKVTLQTPAPLVSATTGGFFGGIKQALGDGVDIAATIILVLIRIVIALIPVLLLIVLPIILLWRFLRRFRRPRPPIPPVTETRAETR